MNQIYREILRSRNDMTEWLIHFTRNTEFQPAQQNLLSILSEGVLRPGWSIRDGRTTIYGPQPAVCFTEQPLIAFCQYLSARNDLQRVSGYGVLVHKRNVFAAGGKPVIYGLQSSIELAPGHEEYEGGKRILDVSCLPKQEQYRYVAFNPNAHSPIDWSHEREWRWPASADIADSLRIPGYPLFNWPVAFQDRGLFEGGAHIFVERDEDIDWLRQWIDDLPSETDNRYKANWPRFLKQEAQIISLVSVQSRHQNGEYMFDRAEGWLNI